MLAQSFMKPEALGISEEEHRALVKVLGLLERREIPKFDMWWPAQHDDPCGTPACICGWARRIAGAPIFDHPLPTQQLANLFLMNADGKTIEAISTPRFRPKDNAQAAVALRSYLTTGEPRWDEALAS